MSATGTNPAFVKVAKLLQHNFNSKYLNNDVINRSEFRKNISKLKSTNEFILKASQDFNIYDVSTGYHV